MVPDDRWTFDCKFNFFILIIYIIKYIVDNIIFLLVHVEDSMDWKDPSFLEALESETFILKKRVEACKSHVLIVTCFDSFPKKINAVSLPKFKIS